MSVNGVGAGILVLSSKLTLLSEKPFGLTVARNTIRHPLFGSGAAICFLTESSGTIVGAIFDSNSIQESPIASGAAVSCLESSVVAIVNSTFSENLAQASGKCLLSPIDDEVRCPISFGGAMMSATSSTLSLASSLSVGNLVSCLGPHCHARGGAMATARDGIVTQDNCACVANTAVCLGACQLVSGEKFFELQPLIF